MLAHQLDLFGLPINTPENPEQNPIVTNEKTEETNTKLTNNREDSDSVVVIRPSTKRDVFITAGDYKKGSTDLIIETSVTNIIKQDLVTDIADTLDLSDDIDHPSLQYEENTGEELLIEDSDNEVSYFFNDESINYSNNDKPDESDISDNEQTIAKTIESGETNQETFKSHQKDSETAFHQNDVIDSPINTAENEVIEIPENSNNEEESIENKEVTATITDEQETLQSQIYVNEEAIDFSTAVAHEEVEQIVSQDIEQENVEPVEVKNSIELTPLQEIIIEKADNPKNETVEQVFTEISGNESNLLDNGIQEDLNAEDVNSDEISIEPEAIDITIINDDPKLTEAASSVKSDAIDNQTETVATKPDTVHNVQNIEYLSVEPEKAVVTTDIKISEPASSQGITENTEELVYRGKKSSTSLEETEAGLKIPADEELRKRQYYNMRETAKMFDVNQSLLRYWESEFNVLQPKKNKKGDRYFRPLDIKNLALIYHLLKVRKFTIEGAKEYLQSNKKALDNHQLIQQLEKLKGFLLELKNTL